MIQPQNAESFVLYDTRKNRVLIYEERVHKVYKPIRYAERHVRRELAALALLDGLSGVPVLLACGLDRLTVVMSRVPGVTLADCDHVSERTLASLRVLVEAMLARGVARHSLPPRDVMVAPDGSAGLVDFERSTRRLFPGDPSWIVAKRVTRFHLMRLVNLHAPQLLTPREQRQLRRMVAVRSALKGPERLMRRALRALRYA